MIPLEHLSILLDKNQIRFLGQSLFDNLCYLLDSKSDMSLVILDIAVNIQIDHDAYQRV